MFDVANSMMKKTRRVQVHGLLIKVVVVSDGDDRNNSISSLLDFPALESEITQFVSLFKKL